MRLFKRKKRRALDHIEFNNLIGEHTVYRGNISGGDNYLVKGQVKGECDITGWLMLWPNARWTGDISAEYVVIAGEVIGDVYARVKLELKSTARIKGDIMSPVIAMAQGALYDGEITMRPKPQVVRYTEKRSDVK